MKSPNLLRSLFGCLLSGIPTLAQSTGLTWVTNPATGNEYALLSPPQTWSVAHFYAQMFGADLCVVNDAAENAWVAANFLTFPLFGIYLGGTDSQVEGQWLNPYGFPLGYTNWAPGQPDNNFGSQHHLVMWPGNPALGIPFATWDDQDGTTLQFAVLERPLPQFVPYGQGCTGSNGVPNLTAAGTSPVPRPGAHVQMALTNLPAAGGVAVGVLSLQDSNIPLDPIGMPGCHALVGLQGAATEGLTFTVASTTWSYSIPNLTVVRGLVLHAQVLVLDPTAGNAFGASTTGRLELRIGW